MKQSLTLASFGVPSCMDTCKSELFNKFPTKELADMWTWKDILLKKSGLEDKMLISTWELWRENLDLWEKYGMPVGIMSKRCWKSVDWEIYGEVEENKWEFCGRNVEFYPDISHIFPVPQFCSSTAISSSTWNDLIDAPCCLHTLLPQPLRPRP